MRKPAQLLCLFTFFCSNGMFFKLASATATPQDAVILQPVTIEQLVQVPVPADESDSDEETVTVTVFPTSATPTPASQAIPLPVAADGSELPPVILVPAAPAPTTPAPSNELIADAVTPASKPLLTPKDICTSGPFQLTRKNWLAADTISWLKTFTQEWRDQTIWSHYGLLGTVAYTHLGRSDYKCGMGTMHSCSVTCQEVVASVPDMWEARNVYFALTAGKHYLQHMEAIDKSIQNAGFTISQWIPQMSFSFFWWRHSDYENLLNAVRQFARSAFLIAVHGAGNQLTPVMDVGMAFEATFSQGMRIKSAHDRAANAYSHWDWFTSAVGLYEDQHKSTQLPEGTHHLADAFYAPSYIVSKPRKFSDWEGNHHMAQEANIAQMGLYIAEIIRKVRGDHFANVNHVLQSDESEVDGTGLFTMVLGAGDFISPFNEAAKKRTGFLEEKMTRAIQYQIFNLAIRSQTTFIQCTKAFADINGVSVPSCQQDTSGPQNMKSCVGDRVCYLYRWDNKGGLMNDHLAEVMGAENFHKPPFDLKLSDVVHSSVLTHIEHMDHAQLGRLWTGKDIESIFEPSAPGSFNIPVCIRDGENWNSPVKPYRFFRDDMNPRSSKKTLPCYCGNEWGGSTAHVWEESGLSAQPQFNDYRQKWCPHLIEKKVQTALERYVAYCQLDIHYKNFLQGYKQGKDTFCDYVIDVVTRNGHGGPQHLEQKIKTALECKLNLFDGKSGTSKKTCDMFYADNEKKLDEKLRSGLATTVEDLQEQARVERERLAAETDVVGQLDKAEPARSQWSYMEDQSE